MPDKKFSPLKLAIIVAVVGALVLVAVVINLPEKIRRARDYRVESDAAELLSSLTSHYLTFFEYPWDVLGELPPQEELIQPSWLTELVNKGKIRSQFLDRPSWGEIYLTDSEGVVLVCFDPASSLFQERADADGKKRDGSDGCLTECYLCLSH